MSALAVIPARYGSTRYPGKPLLRDTGKYLVQHVYERVQQARRVTRCLVATDDNRILEAVRSFGGLAVMTRAAHPSGTDRIAEALAGPQGGHEPIVLNVQGDEPEIEPDALDALVDRLDRDPDCPVATLAAPLPAGSDPADPNCVKVALTPVGRALYFSRARIPYPRDEGALREHGWLLHVGVYAYRREFLLKFAGWPPTPLEKTEKLEQLRVLEHGCPIAVQRIARAAPGVDTPADYDSFVARWRALNG